MFEKKYLAKAAEEEKKQGSVKKQNKRRRIKFQNVQLKGNISKK
jgi:hypothetical protein